MLRNKTHNRQGLLVIVCIIALASLLLMVRLGYLMIAKAAHYGVQAQKLHERERPIKAARGQILDRTGKVIATNQPVYTISVIHSQIKQPDVIISYLAEQLDLEEKTVRKRVEKVSSMERIKTNVDKETADEIRAKKLTGVMVDQDYKRFYQYGSLASRVLGFTGGDNQGIIGLEVTYEKYLKGLDGAILTLTTAHGLEIKNAAEDRMEPVDGHNLTISLDITIQQYAEQIAKRIMEAKNAKSVKIILMSPQNGEIYAMVHVPEFDLNHPFALLEDKDIQLLSQKKQMEALNNQWRNGCISDTYEPGSTFKIITTTAALEEKVVKLTDSFHCPGYFVVEDRRIRCHKAGGHGSETFVEGIMNSCNPVFMQVGARVGVDRMYDYFNQLQLLKKTRIDLPGEAGTIMHQKKNVGAVELATISFGQSFQLSPIRLATTVSSIINGGTTITPHFGVMTETADGDNVKKLSYESGDRIVSKGVSETVQMLLEKVVSEGTGKRAYVEEFHVAAKTGTSEKLPRGNGKYIASCIGFAPAEDPKVLALVMVDEPDGIHYGGTIAAPAIGELMQNALPYLSE